MTSALLELESFSKYFHFILLFSVLNLNGNLVPGLLKPELLLFNYP